MENIFIQWLEDRQDSLASKRSFDVTISEDYGLRDTSQTGLYGYHETETSITIFTSPLKTKQSIIKAAKQHFGEGKIVLYKAVYGDIESLMTDLYFNLLFVNPEKTFNLDPVSRFHHISTIKRAQYDAQLENEVLETASYYNISESEAYERIVSKDFSDLYVRTEPSEELYENIPF